MGNGNSTTDEDDEHGYIPGSPLSIVLLFFASRYRLSVALGSKVVKKTPSSYVDFVAYVAEFSTPLFGGFRVIRGSSFFQNLVARPQAESIVVGDAYSTKLMASPSSEALRAMLNTL